MSKEKERGEKGLSERKKKKRNILRKGERVGKGGIMINKKGLKE
jgi:hypothetical protein